MRTVNYFQIGVSTGSPGRLPRPVAFDEHQKCTRIRVEVTVQLKNNGASPYTLSNTDAVDIMTQMFAATTIAFGDRATEVVDDNLPFARARELALALSGRDMIFNGVFLYQYSATGPNPIVIGAGAVVAVVMEYIRPFVFERATAREEEWCPGATQMQQLQLLITKGNNFAANTGQIVQNVAADCTVLFDTVPGDQDVWAPVPRLFRNEESGLVQSGPAGGGGLLALWEYTAAGPVTVLGLVSLERAGDVPLHLQILGSRLSRDSQLLVPQGAFDPNTLVTMLYQLEESADLNDVPTSNGFKLTQASTYLTPMKTAWLFVPAITPQYRDGTVGPNVLAKKDSAKLVVKGALAGEDPSGHVASISGLAIVTPEHPKYQLVPGRLFLRGQAPSTHIPQAIAGAIAAATSTVSEASTARLVQEAKNVSKFIPGSRSPLRGSQTSEMGEISDALSGNPTGKAHARSFLGRMTGGR